MVARGLTFKGSGWVLQEGLKALRCRCEGCRGFEGLRGFNKVLICMPRFRLVRQSKRSRKTTTK